RQMSMNAPDDVLMLETFELAIIAPAPAVLNAKTSKKTLYGVIPARPNSLDAPHGDSREYYQLQLPSNHVGTAILAVTALVQQGTLTDNETFVSSDAERVCMVF